MIPAIAYYDKLYAVQSQTLEKALSIHQHLLWYYIIQYYDKKCVDLGIEQKIDLG